MDFSLLKTAALFIGLLFMSTIITIVDYGLGNIQSAHQSFKKIITDNSIDARVLISSTPKEISNSTHVVLPGQGAFKSCISSLNKINGMIDVLNDNNLKSEKHRCETMLEAYEKIGCDGLNIGKYELLAGIGYLKAMKNKGVCIANNN